MRDSGDDACHWHLCRDDAEALQVLLERGFRWEGVAEPLRERARRAAHLLALLDVGLPASDGTLVDVTLARVMREGGTLMVQENGASLSPDDAEALDAWVMGGYDSSRVPTSLRPRAERVERLAALVTRRDAPVAVGLIERTWQRIAAVDRHRLLEVRVGGPYRSQGIRLVDLVSVAAVLLLVGSLLWPVLATLREQGRRQVCLGNLGNTGQALALYANSHRDSLPLVTAGMGSAPFWDVQSHAPRANSANLFTLARAGYTSLANLACPGNPEAPTVLRDPRACDWRSLGEISYSYQVMTGPVRPRWNSPQPLAILADRSPVVIRLIRGEVADPMANAPNHRSQGQHVLFTDGTVRWLRTPVLPGGDNIWLPRALECRLAEMRRGLPPGSLCGSESPDAPDDTFLGP